MTVPGLEKSTSVLARRRWQSITYAHQLTTLSTGHNNDSIRCFLSLKRWERNCLSKKWNMDTTCMISRQARKCKSENYDPKCISYAFLEINGGFISTCVWEMLHKVHLRDIIMLLVCTRVSKHDTYVLFCFFIIFYYQRNSFSTRDSRQLESEVECIIYIEQKIDCEGIIIMQCGHQMIGMGTWKGISKFQMSLKKVNKKLNFWKIHENIFAWGHPRKKTLYIKTEEFYTQPHLFQFIFRKLSLDLLRAWFRI